MIRSRSWCWTFNNPSSGDGEIILRRAASEQSVKYMCYGDEVGESGTPHLQGYVYFAYVVSFKRAKELLGPRVHLEKCKGSPSQNIEYCQKDGKFHEVGSRPISQKQKGETQKERWRNVRALASAGKFDEIEDELYVRYYSTLKRIAADSIRNPGGLTDVCGVWIYGTAGSGKSYAVRDLFPNAYPKPVNKWWDGYQQEQVVVIDDVDKNHHVLGHHLKIWGDRYSFIAEIKGAGVWIRPSLVIVTSQYSIEEIWDDAQTRDALNRRYQSIQWMNWFGCQPSLRDCISVKMASLLAPCQSRDPVGSCPEEQCERDDSLSPLL